MLCNLHCRAVLLRYVKFHWNRTIDCRVMATNDFQYGGCPPSWICEIWGPVYEVC